MSQDLELLMPAGSVTKLEMTLEYGADAVYLGPPLYSLRARENHFHQEELKKSIDYVHSKNKKAYMTLNIFARNRKLKPLTADIQEYAKMKPDAFIMSDPGLAMIAKEYAPAIPIHLSVQANCTNWQSVKFWQQSLGVERVILSRELSVQEITEIKQRVPDIELEAFVHGSICIAYSGRCLLSSYMDKRDANQGVCDNSCREKYKVFEKDYFIQGLDEDDRQLYQIDEDEHGTYVLNAKDLCMIEHLDKLVDAGVISFKVEGRTKSEFYAAMVARSYKHALIDVKAGRSFDNRWMQELNKLTHRGYHTAFMLNDPGSEGQNYQSSTQYNKSVQLLGIYKTEGVDIKNKLYVGQKIEIITPQNESVVDEVVSITSLAGENFNEVHSGRGIFKVALKTTSSLPQYAMLLSRSLTT